MAMATTTTTSGVSRPPSGDQPVPEVDRRKGGYSRRLYLRLIWIYMQGSLVAVAVCFLLFYLGLEFTGRQWFFFAVSIPWGMTIYVVPDIFFIHRNYQRIGKALSAIDRGEVPPPEDVSRAIVRALNLPMYAFTRVTFFHGPGAAIAGMIMTLGGNYFFDGQFQPWQIWTLFTIILFFASPTHGIFEFFAVSGAVAPALERLSALPGGDISTDEQKARLRSTSLRRKLLYLAVFVTALPLAFFALSIAFKVTQLIGRMGVQPAPGLLPNLWWWVGGVVFVCMVGTVIMAILTAGEVSRSAAKLLEGMKCIERGDHNVHLRITSTDEYADLFRGFNLMTEGLREEAKILGLSQDLMGELQLDPLLERIMRASTDLLNAERSTLFIYDRKTKELWSRFAEGLGRKEIRFPCNQGIAGSVFTSGKAENIPDPYADSRFNQAVDRATGFRTRCILALPVLNKAGQPIGVVEVLNKRGGQFSHQDENRLRAFSAQAAICLENARLFDEVIQIRDYNESILRSTSNGMLALDAKGVITSANPSAVEMFGGGTIDVAMLLGQNAADVFREKNAWVVASIEKLGTSGDTDLSPDADLHRPNGEVASVNMTAVPLREANQNIVGTLLIFEDLSAEKRARTTMARYMSKEVADELLASGGQALEGREQEISILFSDICGFTSIAETIGPRETVSMLNAYFAEMVEVIFHHGGILDKYIGDAIMALFGAPFVRPGDADRALLSACGMASALKAFNAARAKAGSRLINIGIGLNTGPAILGSIGSPKRMEYTAIGDSVNLASRLEAATRLYDVQILVAEPTMKLLVEKHPVREIDLLRVKGKQQPVAVFEALGHLAPEELAAATSAHAVFAQGLVGYRSGDFKSALEAFGESLRLKADDGPSRLYVTRCQHHLANPPPEWDGVTTLKEK